MIQTVSYGTIILYKLSPHLSHCTSCECGQAQPPLSFTPCTSRECGQPAQARPPLSLTLCTSREPSQPAQARPLSLTPCTSRECGQPAQIRPPISLTPCTSRECGQPAQVRPPFSLTSSESGQPAQERHLLLTPCTLRLNTSRLSPKLSKPVPHSSLAKSMFQVLPKSHHNKYFSFDQLRSKVKSAKANNSVSYTSLQRYQTA